MAYASDQVPAFSRAANSRWSRSMRACSVTFEFSVSRASSIAEHGSIPAKYRPSPSSSPPMSEHISPRQPYTDSTARFTARKSDVVAVSAMWAATTCAAPASHLAICGSTPRANAQPSARSFHPSGLSHVARLLASRLKA